MIFTIIPKVPLLPPHHFCYWRDTQPSCSWIFSLVLRWISLYRNIFAYFILSLGSTIFITTISLSPFILSFYTLFFLLLPCQVLWVLTTFLFSLALFDIFIKLCLVWHKATGDSQYIASYIFTHLSTEQIQHCLKSLITSEAVLFLQFDTGADIHLFSLTKYSTV